MRKKLFKVLLIVLTIVSTFSFISCNKSGCSSCVNDTIKYKITFYVDDNIVTIIESAGNEEIEIPDDPKKEGYVFEGWYIDKDIWSDLFLRDSLIGITLSEDLNIYAKFTPEPHQHSFVETIIEPTCSSVGKIIKECSECGEKEEEILSKLNHDFLEATCYRGKICKNCSFEEGEPLEHKFGEYSGYLQANCDDDAANFAMCERCGARKLNIIPNTAEGHNYEFIQVVERTCTTDGYSLYKCSKCDKSQGLEVVFSSGHVYDEWEIVREPKCKIDGLKQRVCKECGETEEYVLSALEHNYVLNEEEQANLLYKVYFCSSCNNSITVKEELEQKDKPNELIFDQEKTFEFVVIAEDEQSIRNKLKIIDSCLLNTEYENNPEVYTQYDIEKINDKGLFLIKAIDEYDAGATFVAELGDEVYFRDYGGQKLTFSIKSEKQKVAEVKEGIIYLAKLQQQDFRYETKGLVENNGLIYLELQKVDDIDVEDIIYVGEAISAEEALFVDEDGFFGKVEEVYKKENGLYTIVLSCPEFEEVFEKLDVYYNQEIDFSNVSEAENNIKTATVESLKQSDDFIIFLAQTDKALQNFALDRQLIIDPLTVNNYADVVNIPYPSISIRGSRIEIVLNGTINNDIKDSNDRPIGTYDINFTLKAELSFEIGVSYKIKFKWKIIPKGLKYFDVWVNQYSSFSFDFTTNINIDYSLEGNEARYVRNTESGKIHEANCIYLKAINDKTKLQIISESSLERYATENEDCLCKKCRPLDRLKKVAFIKNTNTKILHCYTCESVKSILATNKEYYYGTVEAAKDEGYSYCKVCSPQYREKKDFDSELSKSLLNGDWQTTLSEISEWTNSSANNHLENGYSLCYTEIPVYGPISVAVEVKLILNIKFDASIDYYYNQTQQSRYGIRLEGGVRGYSSSSQGETKSEMHLVGSLDCEFGVRADVGVGISGFTKWIRTGFYAEAGIFVNIDGVAKSSNGEVDYAAVYCESGPYVKVEAYYKLFSLGGNLSIINQREALTSYGYERAYYSFVNEPTTIELVNHKDNELGENLDVYYYDVRKQISSIERLNYNNSHYSLDISLERGDNCSIVNGKIRVNQGASSFEDKVIIKIIGKDNMLNYKKNNSVFYLEQIVIPITYRTSLGLTYELINNGSEYKVLSIGNCADPEITIPGFYNGLPVVEIGVFAFTNSNVRKIVIQEGVSVIREGAFAYCYSLTDVKFPNSLRLIEDGAFYECSSLGDLEFPYGITGIGECVFEGCASLCNIELPESITFIGVGAFSDCDNIEKVNFLGTIDQWCLIEFGEKGGNPTNSAKDLYIQGELLTEVKVGTATKIGEYAFDNCQSISKVEIGQSVKKICSNAFRDCISINYVNYLGTINQWCEIVNNSNPTEFAEDLHIQGELLKHVNINSSFISNFAFYNCKSIETVKVGFQSSSSNIEIGNGAFQGCTALNSVELKQVTIIGPDGFRYCENLSQLTLGNVLEKIGDYAFYGCRTLRNIEIPDSIMSIGDGAFLNTMLQFNIKDDLAYLGNEENKYLCLAGPTSFQIKNAIVDSNCRIILHRAFSQIFSLESIVLGDKIIEIGDEAFYLCEALKTIDIPDSVIRIGDYAFYGCLLEKIYISKNVEKIGHEAFTKTKVYCEAKDKPKDWDEYWDSKNCEIIWDYAKEDFKQEINIISRIKGVDSNVIGLDMYLMALVCEKLDMKMEIISVDSFDMILGSAIDGGGVIATGLNKSATREEFLSFSNCYYNSQHCIVSSIEDGFTSLGQLRGKKIGVKFESIGELAVYYEITNGSLVDCESEVLVYATAEEAYNAFIDGECDCIVIEEIFATQLISGQIVNKANIDVYDAYGEIIYEAYHLAIPKALENRDIYLNVMNEIIEEITPIDMDKIFAYFIALYEEMDIDIIIDIIDLSDNNGEVLKVYTCPDWPPFEFYTNSENGSEGLIYELINNGTEYKVINVGYCLDTEIVISEFYNGKPVTAIDEIAFYECEFLEEIVIPSSIKTIGEGAFGSCVNLKKVLIPEGVISLDNFVFSGCSSLVEIEIPSSVVYIGEGIFSRCSSLTDINVRDGNSVYKSIDGNLYSKDGQTLIQYAIGKEDASFTIMEGVTTLGSIVFADCVHLKKITIPDSVTSIGVWAFDNCSSLEYYVKDGLRYLGNDNNRYMFLVGVESKEIESVTIDNNCRAVLYTAFLECDNLKSITIPDSVTSIGNDAFWNCSSLESVEIGDSVTSIGDEAFLFCASLTSIIFNGTMEEWNNLTKGSYWNNGVPATYVQCIDGRVDL